MASFADGFFGTLAQQIMQKDKEEALLKAYMDMKNAETQANIQPYQNSSDATLDKLLRAKAVSEGNRTAAANMSAMSSPDYLRSLGMTEEEIGTPQLSKTQTDFINNANAHTEQFAKSENTANMANTQALDALVQAKQRYSSDIPNRLAPYAGKVPAATMIQMAEAMDKSRMDNLDETRRNNALTAFMQNPSRETAAAAMNTGIDVTKLTGVLPKTSTYDLNTGPTTNTYSLKVDPLTGEASRGLIGVDEMGLNPGQVQQGTQFQQSLAMDQQRLGLQAMSLQRDIEERDRRFSLDVARIGNDNVKQYLAGQHELLRSLATDASNYLKMAENERDQNKSAQYMQTAQGLISQANQLRTTIDKTMSTLVPGLASSGQAAASDGQNSGGVDYNSAISSIDAALRRNAAASTGQRWNRAQFEDYIRRQYGDLAPNLINDIDWKSFGM